PRSCCSRARARPSRGRRSGPAPSCPSLKARRSPIAPPARPAPSCRPSSRRSMALGPRPLLEAAGRAAISALLAAQLGCATDQLKRAPASPDQAWTVPVDSDYVKPLREASATAGTAAPAVAPQEPKQEQNEEQKLDAAPENRVQLQAGHSYTLPEL